MSVRNNRLGLSQRAQLIRRNHLLVSWSSKQFVNSLCIGTLAIVVHHIPVRAFVPRPSEWRCMRAIGKHGGSLGRKVESGVREGTLGAGDAEGGLGARADTFSAKPISE